MLHKSFKPAKCKTALNLAKSRIKLMKNKKDIQLKQLKREVAQLLDSKQDQTARIRVEHVVREEKMIAAYEMIEIYCELVVARLPIIESQKNCPLDLKEAIASLIFAAPRCGDITELQDVRKHFTAKYGKDFSAAAIELRPNCGVSRSLVEKLSVNAPDGPTKVKILTAIAEEHNIHWEPNWFKDEIPMPSVDISPISNVAANPMEGTKIQMQPLNFEIADDFEEKHAYDTAKPNSSFQSHSHASSNSVPPSSTSRLDSRHSESSSEKIVLGQSSGPSESAFNSGGQKWNMEFKDATAAAQAAAESAELASIAARAAAQLSLRSNIMSESSSIPRHSNMSHKSDENSQNAEIRKRHDQAPVNSTSSGSFNQRSPRMKNERNVNKPENMREAGHSTSFEKNYAQFKEEYEREMQELSESERDESDSSPVASKREPDVFSSSKFDEYEVETSENPFHEEPVEWKNQPSSDFGDHYGVFAKLNYDKYEDDSGRDSFGNFSSNIGGHEDWNVRSSYNYGVEDTTFDDHRDNRYGVSSVENLTFKDLEGENKALESEVKAGFDSNKDIFVDHGVSGKDKDEKSIQIDNKVVFDETDSDSDDNDVLNRTEVHDTSSHSNLTRKDSSFDQENPQFEPDISKSFRSSSLYSKLYEPVPLDFDDSDGNSGNEKEPQREKEDFGVNSFDTDHRSEFMKSSDVEKGNSRSFKTTKYVDEENINTHSNSEFEGGMELNLGSLPVGRRNRARWNLPRDESTDTPSDTIGSSKNPSIFESSNHDQTSGVHTRFDSPSQKQRSSKTRAFQTHFDSPSNDSELASGSKDPDISERQYGMTSRVFVQRNSPKHPTGYFSDDSEPDEDSPKPATSKNFVSTGLSRRTKGSTPRSKTGQTSSFNTSKVSSLRNVDQTSPDNETTTISQRLDSKVPKDDDNSISRESSKVIEVSSSIDKVPSRENSAKLPSHVHPKLPEDFESFTAHLQSLRKNLR